MTAAQDLTVIIISPCYLHPDREGKGDSNRDFFILIFIEKMKVILESSDFKKLVERGLKQGNIRRRKKWKSEGEFS